MSSPEPALRLWTLERAVERHVADLRSLGTWLEELSRNEVYTADALRGAVHGWSLFLATLVLRLRNETNGRAEVTSHDPEDLRVCTNGECDYREENGERFVDHVVDLHRRFCAYCGERTEPACLSCGARRSECVECDGRGTR